MLRGEAELATKRDIERMEAKIDPIETRLGGELTLVRWMMGLILGGVVALIMRAFSPAW